MLNTFGLLQSTCQNVRKKWQVKTPKQRWEFLINFGRVLCEMIGVRIYSDMKIFWYTGTSAVLITIHFTLTVYTVQYYFRRREFVRGMECTCFIGMGALVSL